MITIARLYPDELTLYGEIGNIKALTYALDQKNIKYKVIDIDKEDKIEWNKYDLIYLGSGRENNLKEIQKRLLPYKDELLNYIESEKILLVTGNAISIFSFLDLYEVKRYDERIVSDVEATSSLCKGIIKGFQNTEYLLDGSNHVIFNIEKGIGNNKTKLEGFTYKNFYATTMIGPILARNDNLNNYFIELLTK